MVLAIAEKINPLVIAEPLQEENAMGCQEVRPCVSKHFEASDTFYVDLEPRMVGSETISSVTSVTCADSALTASSAAVLGTATTVSTVARDTDGNTTTTSYIIAANHGVSFVLSGGTSGAGTQAVTIKYLKSSGSTDAYEIGVCVHGEDV